MKPLYDDLLNTVAASSGRIKKYIRQTPLQKSRALSHELGAEIFLKLENWQKTGSFKIRGALNKMLALSSKERQKGVITASAGNHGLGVAFAAELLQVKARIVLPVNASSAKIKKLSYFGCEVVQAGNDYDEAEDVAHQIARDCGLTFVHAFDDPQVIAGQGTVGLEITRQLPDVELVIVPIGGGGLVSGVAPYIKHLKPNSEIIGVQPQASPAMIRSLEMGKVVETPILPTLADGLAGRFVSDLTLEATQHYVDNVIAVTENEIREAMLFMLEENSMLIEGAAAASLAALLSRKVDPGGKKTVVLITGRNVALSSVKSILG